MVEGESGLAQVGKIASELSLKQRALGLTERWSAAVFTLCTVGKLCTLF